MTGREYAALLHEAAAFFDSHPTLPIPDAFSSLAVYYEMPDADAQKVLDVVKNEGFIPQSSSTGGLVIWERQCGSGTLCFLLPTGEATDLN